MRSLNYQLLYSGRLVIVAPSIFIECHPPYFDQRVYKSRRK